MNNKVKIAKRLISFLLVFLFSINSLAAITGDNDGSAFITKAEFDSLKNNFQSQIDSYNQGIDSKIDAAIAAYLAGVKISMQTDYPVLVDNYSEIRWMDAHKMKLQTLTFTDATTRSVSSAQYITPYYEQRRNILGTYVHIYDFVSDNSWGGGLCHFYLEWKPDNSVTTKLHWGNQGTDEPAMHQVPVVFIKIKRDNTTKKYYIEDIVNENCWLTKVSSFGHPPTEQLQFYNVGGADETPKENAFTINSPDDNVYFDYRIDLVSTRWWRSQMTPNNTWIAGPWNTRQLSDDMKQANRLIMNETYGKYEYPVHFNWNGNTTQTNNDRNNLRYLMLGTDDDVTANCCKYYTDLDIVNGEFYDWSDSLIEKKKGYITHATFNGGKITNAERTNQPQDPSNGKTVEIDFGIPLWPRYKLRTLFTGHFKNKSNGLDLSIGAGLPIVANVDKKKTVRITFDYSKVNTEAGVTVTPNSKIYLTLKKSDFETTGGTDFLTGSVNGGIKQTLNKVEATGGTAKIDIDCEEGDKVWLRIANTTDGSEPGIYTKMTNLKVIGTEEN